MQLAILDLSSFAWRYFKAIPESLHHGRNVNAVRGVDGLVRSFQTKRRYTHLVAAADSVESVRQRMFPRYKSDREEKPADFLWQLGVIDDLLGFLEVPVVRHEGWEADDVIATIAKRACRAAIGTVTVFAEDKDIWQLLTMDRLRVERKQGAFGRPELEDRWGIRPDQVVDFLAIVGDAADCIPGIPRVGEKTAGRLLGQFGSADGIYAHESELPEKQRDAFRDNWQQLMAMRSLIRLRSNLPIPRVGNASEISLIDSRPFWGRSHLFEGAHDEQADFVFFD